VQILIRFVALSWREGQFWCEPNHFRGGRGWVVPPAAAAYFLPLYNH